MLIPRAVGLPITHRNWLYLLLGCLLQALVFLADTLTPLGFAHGILYAPAVLLGMAARQGRWIGLMVALGLVGNVLGMLSSPGVLPGVEWKYIQLNRVLGCGAVLLTGLACLIGLRLVERHRRTTRELQQTTALLEVSSTVGQLGGWRVELPEHRPHWSNEVFRLLGQEPGPIPDIKSTMALYAPEHRERVRSAFQNCVEQGQNFDEIAELHLPSGEHRWIRIAGEAVRTTDGQITAVQGAIQDINAFMQTQRELEHSRGEWRLLAESLPMMVWLANDRGEVTFLSRHAAEFTGSNEVSLSGSGWLSHLHPEDREVTVKQWFTAVASSESYNAEYRIRRADGVWHWHLARAVRLRMPDGKHRWYGTALDIQDLRDEQERRERLADKLANTLESVTDAILVIDSEWRFAYLNTHAERLLEQSRETLLGRNIWEAFPDAAGSAFQAQYERCVKEQVAVRFDAPFDPLGKHFEINAYPNDGGVVVYVRDVTVDRRVAEQLQQAQRMDSLGQLTGGVAHDFNNLLTVILGNAEVLAEQFGTTDQQRIMADMIAAAALRGAEMTQRLLAFARKQALEPRAVDINRLVRQFVPLLQRTLGEHIEIEIVSAAGLWTTLVDPGQLEAALLNLSVNARDAMPSGGRLTIETANTRLDDAYAALHSEVQPGQYVMLAVSDTGHGMTPEVLSRVFEPFFTTKQVGRGTGLGLPMIYGFVKQSQGHAAIYSEQLRGTTVKLYFPRIFSKAEQNANSESNSKEHTGEGELILLVEDDTLVRNFARRQIETLGYRVIEADNGQTALDLLEQHPDVALLFTDVVMPGRLNGRQLAESARTLRPDLPVLYTSGYTENAIVHHGHLDPDVLLLSKPYLRSQLAEKLAQALKKSGHKSPPTSE